MKHFITIINYLNFNIIYLLLTINFNYRKIYECSTQKTVDSYITLNSFNCLTTFIIIRNVYDALTSTGMFYIRVIKRFAHPLLY